VELYIDYDGVLRLEAARMFVDLAFSKRLIDSHPLFSPWKMNRPLKFEPPADQILKGPDHEADKDDELRLFC
jgi:hypothetical protein